MSDLEAEVTKDEQAIAELHNKTKELQAQVNQDKDQLRRWKELHDDLQSRNEMIQQAEQQTRVVLEGAQIRVMPTLACPSPGVRLMFVAAYVLTHHPTHTDHVSSRQGLRLILPQIAIDIWEVIEEGGGLMEHSGTQRARASIIHGESGPWVGGSVIASHLSCLHPATALLFLQCFSLPASSPLISSKLLVCEHEQPDSGHPSKKRDCFTSIAAQLGVGAQEPPLFHAGI